MTDPYLKIDHLSLLCNVWKHRGHVTASKAIDDTLRSKGVDASDLKFLSDEGFLDRGRNGQYTSNRRTEKVLVDHGFDLDEIPIIEKKPQVKRNDEKVAEKIQQRIDSSEDLTPARIRAVSLRKAKMEAIGGSPWRLIEIMWPELVIHDELDLRYFKKHCERDYALNLRLDDVQCEFALHLFDPTIREIAIKGSTSPGKGFITALCLCLWYYLYPDDRIIMTSQSSAHSKDVMFAELVTWRKKMAHPGSGANLTTELKDPDNPRHSLIIANPETGEGVSGRHGANTLGVVDESSAVPQFMLKNLRKQCRKIICISNPRVLSGWFFDLFPKEDPDKNQVFIQRGIKRACLTFGGRDCLNVRAKRLQMPEFAPPGGIEFETIDGEEYFYAEGDPIDKEVQKHVRALIPGQMDYLKYTTIMQGVDDIEKAWSGEGKFPPEDLEMQVVPPSWMRGPMEMWSEHRDEIQISGFGLDLAYSVDKDKTVLTYGGTAGIKGKKWTRKADTRSTLSWIVETCKSLGIDICLGDHPMAIDIIGAGGVAMADILEDAGCWVIRVHGNEAPVRFPKRYMNRRAELYGEFGARINPDSQHLDPFMIFNDTELVDEMAAHEKIYDTDMQKYYITPKQRSQNKKRAALPTIKEKIGRSPDTSDSVVLCYEAVHQADFGDAVLDQVDIVFAIQSVSDGKKGEKIVDYMGGHTDIMSDCEFEEAFGSRVVTVDDERKSLQSALDDVRESLRSGGDFKYSTR